MRLTRWTFLFALCLLSLPSLFASVTGSPFPIDTDVLHLKSNGLHGSLGGRFLKIGTEGGAWGQFLHSSDGSNDGARFPLPHSGSDLAYLPATGKYLVAYPGVTVAGDAALWTFLIDGTTGAATTPQISYARTDPPDVSTSFTQVCVSATPNGWALGFIADSYDFNTSLQTLTAECVVLTSSGTLLSGPVLARSESWDSGDPEHHGWTQHPLQSGVIRDGASDVWCMTWIDEGTTLSGSERYSLLAAVINLTTGTRTREWAVESLTIPGSSDDLSTLRNPRITANDVQNEFMIAWTRVNASGRANVSASRFNGVGAALGSRFFIKGDLSQEETDYDLAEVSYSSLGNVYFIVWNEEVWNVYASTVTGGTSTVNTGDIPIAVTPGSEQALSACLNEADTHVLVQMRVDGLPKAVLYEILAVAPLIRINNGDSFVPSTNVTLSLLATNAGGGASQMRFSNDGGSWTAWEPYATTRNWTLTAAEGTRTVSVQFLDLAGGISAPFSDSIVLDVTAPAGTLVINSGAAFTMNPSVTLALSATDSGSGVSDFRVSNDGLSWSAWQPYATATPWSLSMGDGSKTVAVQFRDAAGNTSPSTTDTILLDTTGPVGTVTINNNAATTSSPSITLTSSVTDAGSGVSLMRVANDGGGWSAWLSFSALKPWTLTSLAGTRSVSVQYCDAVGNPSATATDSITLEPSALINAGAIYATTSAVTLGLVGPAGSTQMRLSEDGATWTGWEAYAATRTWTFGTGDGTRTIHVQFADASSSILGTLTDTIVLDRTAPANISILINGGTPYTATPAISLTLSATDTTSGVSQMQLSSLAEGSLPWEPYQTSHAWTLPATDGLYYVSVRFMDQAGVISSIVSDIIVLDQTPPTGSLSINAGSATTATRSVSLTLSATDARSGVPTMRLSQDGITWNSWTSYATPIPWTLPAGDGTPFVYVQFRDGAGNMSASFSDSILLDTTPPAPAVSINAGAPHTSSSLVLLSPSATDAGSGVSMMRFSNDALSWSLWESYATPRSWSLIAGDGIRTVYAQFKDAAGNTSTSASDTLLVDSTGPSGSIVINGGSSHTSSLAVTLTLSAVDAGVGTSDMRFSNDAITWNEWSSFATSAPWTLPSGDGTKTVYAQFRDAAGNISTTINDTIIVETTPPTVTIEQAVGQPDPTCVAEIRFLVTFSEPVSDFLEEDILIDSSAGPAQAAISGSGVSYIVSVMGMNAPGTVTASIPAGVATDAIGNPNLASTSTDNTVNFDPTPPTGSIAINGGAEFTSATGVTLTLTAADAETEVTDMRLSNDNATWSDWVAYEDLLQWGLSAGDGVKTVHVQFRNAAGGVSGVISDTVRLDSTGPTGSIIVNGGASYISTTAAILTLTASDGGSGVVQMRLSNDASTWSAWVAYSTSASWMLTAGDGLKTVSVQFKDTLGFISATVSDTIVLDTLAPSGSILIQGGAASTSTASVTLNLSATDAASGVSAMRFSNDAISWSSWMAYSSSATWTLSAGSGTRTVHAQFRDASGLVSSTVSDSINLIIPEIFSGSILINNGATATSSYSVTLKLSASGGPYPVTQMRFSNNNITWTAWEAFAPSRAWTLPKWDGTKTVYAQFMNSGGIVSPVASDSIVKYTPISKNLYW